MSLTMSSDPGACDCVSAILYISLAPSFSTLTLLPRLPFSSLTCNCLISELGWSSQFSVLMASCIDICGQA